MAVAVFDESQPKYKCCCGCMSVRTGAAIIGTLKALGVIITLLELFTGPNLYSVNNPHSIKLISTTTMTTTTTTALAIGLKNSFNSDTIDTSDSESDAGFSSNLKFDPSTDDNPSSALTENTTPDSTYGVDAIRLTLTILYLMGEAVAVSCLFYAIRRDRPKFVLPEMILILICMSVELVAALLLVLAASIGSESFVQLIVVRLKEQGTDVTSGDIEYIRHLLPMALALVALFFIVGAAIEFWFFRTLKLYYRYLCDKVAFHRGFNAGNVVLHCGYNHAGYQPMVEDGGSSVAGVAEEQKLKDMPPAYQDAIAKADTAPTTNPTQPPPSYKEFAE